MHENLAVDLMKSAISENDHDKILTILLKVGPEEITPPLWVGALHHACLSNNLKAIDMLLTYIPALLELNLQSEAHTLQFCAAYNCLEPARKILTKGKELRQSDKKEALEIALNAGFFELSYVLLQAKAPLFDFNQRGETPFHIAVRFGEIDFLSYLLEEYPSVKNIPFYGNVGENTPLLYVFKCHGEKNTELASKLGKLLIQSEVNINMTRANGVGPLHLSVIYNIPELYRALRQRGCNHDKLDSTGKTALQLLMELRPMELELYLKDDPMLVITSTLSSSSEHTVQPENCGSEQKPQRRSTP